MKEWRQVIFKFNLPSVVQCMQLQFLTAVTKYLNFATFSKVLSAVFMLWFCPAVIMTRQNIYFVFSGLAVRPQSLQTSNHSKCKSQSTKAQNHLHKSNTPLANPQQLSTNPDISRKVSSKHTHFNGFHSVLSGSKPKVTHCLT